MTDEKKPALWTKLFGAKHSSCCELKIEEVTEEMKEKVEKAATEEECPAQQAPCCCNQSPPVKKYERSLDRVDDKEIIHGRTD